MANQHSPKLPKVREKVEIDVPLDLIDPFSVQSRVTINPDTVEQYTLALTEHKAKFPRVEAFTWVDETGQHVGYFLGDGFHREKAYRAADRKTIPANVHVYGTREEAYAAAQWCSITSNATHGLKRSQADRRRAIKLAIETQPHLNDTRIAALVLVDQKTVSRVRAEMEGRPDPYEKPGAEIPVEMAPENPEGPALPGGDPLENVKTEASRILREKTEAKQPLPAKRIKALGKAIEAVRSCRGLLRMLEATREPELCMVLVEIDTFLKRCGIDPDTMGLPARNGDSPEPAPQEESA